MLQDAIADATLKLSSHRLCALDIKVDPKVKKPSSVCVMVASTMSMQSHDCKCNVDQGTHANDLDVKSTATMSQHKDAALVKAARIILKSAQGTCSGSTPSDQIRPALSKFSSQLEGRRAYTYPTEERERQKVRLKALREAGK